MDADTSTLIMMGFNRYSPKHCVWGNIYLAELHHFLLGSQIVGNRDRTHIDLYQLNSQFIIRPPVINFEKSTL
jgi:hypothetical protein